MILGGSDILFADIQLPMAEMLSGIVFLPATETDNILLFFPPPSFSTFWCR
jgi:hypothetical protein